MHENQIIYIEGGNVSGSVTIDGKDNSQYYSRVKKKKNPEQRCHNEIFKISKFTTLLKDL